MADMREEMREEMRGVTTRRGAYGKVIPRLRALREAAGLSTYELANAAGVSHTTILGAEKGAHVRWATVRKLAGYFEMSTGALLAAEAEAGDAPAETVTA